MSDQKQSVNESSVTQPEQMVSLAAISRQCTIPAQTLSGFIKDGLSFSPNPKNLREKLVKVSDLNAFLATDEAGKHQGKRYGEAPTASATALPAGSSKIAPPKTEGPGANDGESDSTPCTRELPVPRKGPPAASASCKKDTTDHPRRPCQLKRFKRDARRLSISELQWAIRYCQCRLDRCISAESDQLAQSAFRMETEMENAGLR